MNLNRLVVCFCFLAFSQMAFSFGPRPDANPNVGMDGAASMHGDTASSDTTPLAGPGTGGNHVISKNFLSACSTILIRSDGHPLILCTSFIGQNPVIRILNKDTGNSMAKLELSSGSLLGGVYAYLDNEDRLVMVDGNHNLIKVKARERSILFLKYWDVFVQRSYSLANAVTSHCGGGSCDAVVSISAGDNGDIWFATQKGVVGIWEDATETTSWIKLAADERVDNSFSTINGGGAAVATNRALYRLQQNSSSAPEIVWRQTYDAGSNRKPGQLSNGTGATPTFFGPLNGDEYVTITDNADNALNLLVMDADDGTVICEQPIFGTGATGTENSAIGIGNSVIVASTYGYPYPAVPEGAGPAVPESADFVGGMVRVDVRQDESGCDLIWENDVRSAAVPKLHTPEELIYTVERGATLGGNSTSIIDTYHFTVIDPYTGSLLQQTFLGATTLDDTLQMAGNAGHNGVYWQGTLSGIKRISP